MESSKLPSHNHSSSNSDDDGKKHLMYNYRGQKVLKHKRQVADKKLVKKSILLFEAGNEDADYLKGVLLESAKKHKLDNEHDGGLRLNKKKSPGALKKKKGKKPKTGERSRYRKDPSSSSSPKQRKQTASSAKLKEKTDKNDRASKSKSPKKDKLPKQKITKDELVFKQQRPEQEELQVQSEPEPKQELHKQHEEDQRQHQQNKHELVQQKHEETQKRADAVKEKLNNSLNSLQSLISAEGGDDSTSPVISSELMAAQTKSPRQEKSSTLNSTSPRAPYNTAASCDKKQTHSDDDTAEIISNPWLQQSPKSAKYSSFTRTEQIDDLPSPEISSLDRKDDSPEGNQLPVQSQHSTMTAEESRQVARDALEKVSTHTQNLEMVEDVAADTRSVDGGNNGDMEQPPPHWNGTLSEFVDVKRSLWKLLDNNDGCTEKTTKPLLDKYGIDHEDVELAVEHIKFAQIYNNGIRWDLIGSLFFPESYGDDDDGVEVSRSDNSLKQNRREQTQPAPTSAHASEDEYEKSFPEISEEMLNDMVDEEVVEEETIDDGSSIPLREQYQEVILDVYEAMEDVLSYLPPKDAAVRQQALIHLLRATSEDEAHLTTLSLDDLHEIISHFELCLEHGVDSLQWSMVEEIVFPLGISEQDPSSSTRSSNFADLGDEELEAVLNHINLATQQGEDIRWDLVAEILFPCDPVFQKILGGDNITGSSTGNNGNKDGDGGGRSSTIIGDVGLTKNNEGGVDTVARERARAVLSLSNHDLEIIESVEVVDEEVLEDSYDSFCEISVDDDDDDVDEEGE